MLTASVGVLGLRPRLPDTTKRKALRSTSRLALGGRAGVRCSGDGGLGGGLGEGRNHVSGGRDGGGSVLFRGGGGRGDDGRALAHALAVATAAGEEDEEGGVCRHVQRFYFTVPGLFAAICVNLLFVSGASYVVAKLVKAGLLSSVFASEATALWIAAVLPCATLALPLVHRERRHASADAGARAATEPGCVSTDENGLSADIQRSHASLAAEIEKLRTDMVTGFERLGARIDNRLSASDGALLVVLKHLAGPRSAPLDARVAAECASALLPPAADAAAPGVDVFLKRAGADPHDKRRFGWDEPACNLRAWAEARTPGCLAASPALRVRWAPNDGGDGVRLDEGGSVAAALAKAGAVPGGMALLVVVV